MADPMTAIAGAQLGLQTGQAVQSGLKGAQASSQADASLNRQQDITNGMADAGMRGIGSIFDSLANFNNPALGNQIYNQAQGAAGNLNDIYTRAGNAMAGFSGAQAIDNNLASLGGFTGGNTADLINRSAGVLDNSMLQGFNFDPTKQLQQQAVQFGQESAARAREQAAGQNAMAFQQGADQLDAALASRGLSRGGGTAAGALSDFALQGATQRAALNNQLADMQGNLGLQYGQFDVQSGLQLAGMQAQDNQALNAGRLQNAANALGAEGLYAGALASDNQLNSFLNQAKAGLAQSGAQMDFNKIGAGADLLAQGQTSGLGLLQNLYQQNYLNPYMQTLGILNPSGLLGTAYQGQQGITDAYAGQAEAGGLGKGAASAGAAQTGFDNPDLFNKGATVPIPVPNFSGGYTGSQGLNPVGGAGLVF